MKEPARAINKGLCFNRGFIHKAKSPMVLLKRSLIHSDSFQPKNLIVYEAPLRSICFKGLNYYD